MLSFYDTDSPRRGKPIGATQLRLFRRFADQPDAAMQLVGCFTPPPMRIKDDVADNEPIVIYQAR